MNCPSENFACGICRNRSGNRTHTAREMMYGRQDPFNYIECAVCGCLQISKIPRNLFDYYGETYYSLNSQLDAEFSDAALRQQRGMSAHRLLTLPRLLAARVQHADMRRPLWALRRLKLSTRSRVLDVGCGGGRLLYLLQMAGWRNLLGIDPFLESDILYNSDLTIRRATLDEVDGQWDSIMFHHSFEHVPDPLATLKSVAARLAPNGTGLLRIPVADSDAWRTYGTDWVQLDAPRHLFLFTRRSMDILAAQAGLKVVAVDYDSYDFQFWGSEQYRRGIPLFSEKSYCWGAGAPIFSAEQISVWQKKSKKLNDEGKGDQAAFYLKHL